MKKNVILVIMDGYGIREETKGNAISLAKKPNLDALFNKYPHTLLKASGEAVGLPAGQMGNSEVGHLNIGAGRVVYQSLTRVNLAVKNDELQHVAAVDQAFENAIKNNSKLHIMGLLSDGGVHSHLDHILYLLEKGIARGIKEVVVHGFLDGRDVPPKSAATYFKTLAKTIENTPGSKIGVISGRYYAMDRDRNFERTQLAYDALVYEEAPQKDLFAGLEESYNEGVTDEFVKPYIVNSDIKINDGDSVIFANFRPDRAIQISTALTNSEATPIKRAKVFNDLTFVSMMLYSENVKGLIALPLQTLDNTLGDVLADNGLTQLRIAETEKYAHVTYFLDGGIEKDLPGAKRILVDSPKVATYDLMPEMSAPEVTEKVLTAIKSQKFDAIILNYANCDMVGHTTDIAATVKAVEVVDESVGKIYAALQTYGGTMLLTADHGNADKLIDEDGKPFSAHTTSSVPFLITSNEVTLRAGATLGDIAPTMLDCLNVKKPNEMLGSSIIKK